MPDKRLSRIDDLLEENDTSLERRAMGAVRWLLVAAGFLATCFAAYVVWDARSQTDLPAALFGIVAGLAVAAPMTAAVVSHRRGAGVLVLLALIAPVVVWICCAMFLVVAMFLDRPNVI